MALVFGLDIGIASIGWAAIDDTQEITPLLGLGSRIFVAAEVPKTGESLAKPRREARGMRRRIRRRAHRMARIRRLFYRVGLINDVVPEVLSDITADDLTPWLLRADGLDRQLNQRDWARVLLHIAKHRGFKSNRKSEASDKEGGKLLQGVTGNAKLLHDKNYRTIGEMVWKDEKFAEHKRNKGGDYSHTVARDDLLLEIKTLFQAQRKLGNTFAQADFEEDYTKIFASQRPVDDGEIADMVGFCTFEPDEKRAAKATYSAERFVLLSRLNNLMLIEAGERRVLDAAQRKTIETMAYKLTKVKYSQIRTALDLSASVRFNLVQYNSGEIDKSEDSAFAELKAYHKLKKVITDSCGELVWGNLTNQPDKLDAIATALTWYKSDDKIREVLAPEQIEPALLDAVLAESFDKAVALSLKALRNINPFLAQGLRYDEACTAAGYDHSAPTEAQPQQFLPYIPTDEVRNPVVLRALTQARKVINAMIRRYGSPTQINIELSRELSQPYSERKDIEGKQKEFQAEKERTVKQFNDTFGRDPRGDEFTKFRLWREYNYCAYSGTYLDPARLLEEGYAEIDHILPYSRSMDDSLNNKVLCTSKANRDKGNKTPYEYLNGASASPQWHDYKIRIETHKAFRQAKRNRLLRVDFDEKAEQEFRERNLNDTRYIARFLQEFLKLNLQFAPSENKIKVQTRNGAVTSFLRAHWGLLKVRADGDLHHALDAAVVACTTQGFVKRVSDYSRRKELWASDKKVGDNTRNLEITDTDTGEITATNYQKKDGRDFPLPWENFRADVKDALTEIFVSRAPTRKATGGVHDEKIRSTKRMTGEKPVTTSKTKLQDLSLASLENIPEKETRNANLYEALKKRIETGGKEPFAKPFYLGKNGEESDDAFGRLIKGVKLERTTKTGVLVRGGLADNGEMLRVDVFTKTGRFYLVPIYLADRVSGVLPNKAIRAATLEQDWPEIDETYQFAFSLCNNDLILIADKKGEDNSFLRGYFKRAHRGTGNINIEGHDRSWKKEGVGVQNIGTFKKLQVDVLGNVFEVKQEPRHGLAESAD
ncbi:MAG: type II CRISPR RNA-guided endonuclease Cas9 [Methylotenera sp.]|nr:type II CRISPR RNA-guided endonuclease Cas9 [Methylotenera sp.]